MVYKGGGGGGVMMHCVRVIFRIALGYTITEFQINATLLFGDIGTYILFKQSKRGYKLNFILKNIRSLWLMWMDKFRQLTCSARPGSSPVRRCWCRARRTRSTWRSSGSIPISRAAGGSRTAVRYWEKEADGQMLKTTISQYAWEKNINSLVGKQTLVWDVCWFIFLIGFIEKIKQNCNSDVFWITSLNLFCIFITFSLFLFITYMLCLFYNLPLFKMLYFNILIL